MPMYRVTERIYQEHYVEAEDKWAAREKVANDQTEGEPYDWEVMDIEEVEDEEA